PDGPDDEQFARGRPEGLNQSSPGRFGSWKPPYGDPQLNRPVSWGPDGTPIMRPDEWVTQKDGTQALRREPSRQGDAQAAGRILRGPTYDEMIQNPVFHKDGEPVLREDGTQVKRGDAQAAGRILGPGRGVFRVTDSDGVPRIIDQR